MKTLIVIDVVGDSYAVIEQAALKAGWNVISKSARTADAIIFATDAAGLGATLMNMATARRSGAVVALVTDLQRRDRSLFYGLAGILDADALFDKPVDGDAVIRRVAGIVATRLSRPPPTAPDTTAILDRAIINEESAAAFYRRAAARVCDPVTRDALEELMRDELEHKRLIEEFRSGARPLPRGSTSGGSIVESFGTPEFTADMSPPDAFLLAAKKEKAAVDFYENWAKLYPDGPEHVLLLSLAEIEKRHKLKVEELFTNAAFPEAW